ncbi:hypothetical protein BDW02DRAFT_581847 [Decorospora gaudefroyi]|uniref:Uncharacterized protein n=1 Tax=Decorospora gaudefroyi TaxID=184978 RepID=A0A6A5KB95_9PLEO|nr:hypothetical protein BDW02DRAFT_581847 [Decorospora gaudefroyi]
MATTRAVRRLCFYTWPPDDAVADSKRRSRPTRYSSCSLALRDLLLNTTWLMWQLGERERERQRHVSCGLRGPPRQQCEYPLSRPSPVPLSPDPSSRSSPCRDDSLTPSLRDSCVKFPLSDIIAHIPVSLVALGKERVSLLDRRLVLEYLRYAYACRASTRGGQIMASGTLASRGGTTGLSAEPYLKLAVVTLSVLRRGASSGQPPGPLCVRDSKVEVTVTRP